MNSSSKCPNCNSAIDGRFCSTCGQDQRPLPFTLPAMLRAAAQEIFEVDGRLIRTLRTMLIHPGRITQDFLGGRRAAYLPPFRTYIIASVILYFSINLLTAGVTFTIDLTGEPVHPVQGTSATETGFISILDDRFDAVAGSAEFGKSVYKHLPEVGFLLLPFVALLLKILYFGSHRPIGEHLLAAVHIKTGVFIVLIVAAIVGGISTAAGWINETGGVATVALAASAGYVGLSLHTVYGGSIILSLVRTVLVVLTYWMLAAIGLVGVAAVLVLTSPP